uniref:MULE transposase domain-containing protein n=1 Tax=Daphnia galeata TaxID=27404 RepID=A0A8J2WFU0_9CRUS|nr:unnamed protein product [Daphnia galeata]
MKLRFSRLTFKLRINSGEGPESFTTEFNKKTQNPYIRTLKSVLDSAKEREDEQPTEVYLDLIKKVGENMKKQAVHAPRDLKQIENAQRNNREFKKMSHDAQFNAYEVGQETYFMRKFQLFPEVNIACMHFEMAKEFKLLFNRIDTPSILAEYDTTFDMGNFCVSWWSFGHTEFKDLPDNPMPTMGLACLIHSKKTQSSHEYFFNMIKEEIPELQSAKNILMCTDEEKAIVNAFKKVFPDIPHARCHIHAWRNIKKKLRSIGSPRRQKKLNTEGSFMNCCIQKRTQSTMQFNTTAQIHPDMKNMGVWALTKYGVNHLLQTNRQEINALLKRRFTKHRGYGEEEVIEGSSEIVGNDSKVLAKKYIPSPTVLSRAKCIILENRLSLSPLQKCFTVSSHGEKKYVVTLFAGESGEPQQTCSCASTVTWAHIMAAMLSIGYVPRKSNKQPNGTRMRKNEEN